MQIEHFAFILGTLIITNVIAASALPDKHISKNFQSTEFACHHCGEIVIDMRLIVMLERLRRAIEDRPIIITSGYRCKKHNKAVGGVRNSQHLLGRAADIKVVGLSPNDLGERARAIGLTFVLEYKTWIHVDVREVKK